MNRWMGGAALAGALAMLGTAPVAADTTQWLRKGDQVITVNTDGGQMFCTRAGDGFEMCHGMVSQGGGIWTGPNMKHPDMPGFMTFNGTVTMGSSRLKIEGCVLGGAICDAEIWEKM